MPRGSAVTANVDRKVVASFGRQWTAYDQAALSDQERAEIFAGYFEHFPWSALPPNAVGFDFGCGSGRWARCVAPRVGRLYCLDASPAALEVARAAVGSQPNCECLLAEGTIPLPDGTMDFGYALGVLHHLPDPEQGLRTCVAKLKPRAPFLLYVYHSLEDSPTWLYTVWKISDIVRRVISRAPYPMKLALTTAMASTVYWPASRIARIGEAMGCAVDHLPLSQYRRRSFYTMRTDALDQFETRLEHRFAREEARAMMERAGLYRVTFSQSVRWAAVGYRRP